MNASPTDSQNGSSDLLVDTVETLETCGLDPEEYHLQDWVDVDALEQLLGSSNGTVSVRFTVRDTELLATSNGVQLSEDAVDSQ